MEFVRQIQSIT